MTKRPNYRLVSAVAGVALLASALGVLIGPSAVAPEPSGDATDGTKEFHWEAPRNLTGDFVAVLTLHADNRTVCDISGRGTHRVGPTDAVPPIVFHYRALHQGSGGRIIQEGRVMRAAAVHGQADGRLNTWGTLFFGKTSWEGFNGGATFGNDWGGHDLTLTFAGFSLGYVPEAPTEHPLEIHVECDGAVEIDRAAGRHARGFTHQTFADGGAGASLEGPLSGDTMVYRDARINETFDNETVWFQAGMYSEEGDTTQGDLRLDHPNGSRAWSVPTGDEPADDTVIHLDDGPGRYLAELDLVNGPGTGGLPDHTHVMGILAGVDPVDSLDEVV